MCAIWCVGFVFLSTAWADCRAGVFINRAFFTCRRNLFRNHKDKDQGNDSDDKQSKEATGDGIKTLRDTGCNNKTDKANKRKG